MSNLTQNDLNLIIEALLFSACPDTSSNWDQAQVREMIDLACRLKTEETMLSNITIFTLPGEVLDSNTQIILNENFKGISVEQLKNIIV